MVEKQQFLKTPEQLHQEYIDIAKSIGGLLYFVQDINNDSFISEKVSIAVIPCGDISNAYEKGQLSIEEAVLRSKKSFEVARQVAIDLGVPPEALSMDKLKAYYAMMCIENSSGEKVVEENIEEDE